MKRTLPIILGVCAAFFGLSVSGLATMLADRLEYPTYFKLRSLLGRSPTLSPKLKVVLFDDASAMRIGRLELGEKSLYQAIRAVAVKKPRMIMVLNGYGMPVSRYTASYYAQKITSLDVPIVFAAVGNEDEGGSAAPLRERAGDFSLFRWTAASADACPRPGSRYQIVYGPNRQFLDGHDSLRLGLTNILAPKSFVPLFAGPSGYVLPNAAIFAARTRTCDAGRLVLDGVPVPLDGAGTTLTNFVEPERLAKESHSFYFGVLARAEDGYPAYFVNPDDVVVIVAGLTGRSSFDDTPFGQLPSYALGLMHVNSILTGQWLSRIDDYGLLTAGASLAGAAAILFPGVAAIVAALAGSAAIVLAALALFTYFGIVLPMALPAAAFLSTGMVLFVHRAWWRDREILRLKVAEAERDLLRTEMRDAALIAEALVPAAPPVSPAFAIDVYHRSIRDASGDWFAFEQAPDGGLLHVVLCDITGHGVQGAIIAATCKAALSALVRGEPGLRASPLFLAAYVDRLNATLFEQGRGMHVLTMVALCFEWSRGQVHVFLAGHPPPLIVKADGELLAPSVISQHNPLGLDPQVHVRFLALPFGPGSQLIAFTDGVPLPASSRQMLRRLGADWPRALGGPAQFYELAWQAETARSGRLPDDDAGIIWVRNRLAEAASSADVLVQAS